MKNDSMEFIREEIVTGALKANSPGFMTLTQFFKALSPESRKNLGLPAKATQVVIKSRLEPLPKNYKLLRKRSSFYIVREAQAEDLMTDNVILDMIRENEGKTVAELSNKFPFTKDVTVKLIIEQANRLLKNGKVSVQITPRERARLYPAPELIQSTGKETGIANPVLPEGIQNRRAVFKKALDAVGKGKPFVFICEIRRHLNWPRDQFDQLLAQLRKEGYVAAHTGNPGDLPTEDVIDSYQDSYGDLYITVNWRKPL